MSMKCPGILYYISGHGYGHARRCAQTMRILSRMRPEIAIHVRTMADPEIFRDLPVRFERTPIDRGALEIDPMTIDWQATLADVRGLLASKDELIAREAAYIRERGIGLIIADVPFLAGYVGRAAGVPCWAQCNFMWDWVYEQHTDDRELLEAIRGGYRLMTGHLRLQFPHECDHFRQVVDLPLITSPLTMSVGQARAAMGVRESDGRPIVLIAMRGGTAPAVLRNLRRAAERYLFVTPQGQVFDSTPEQGQHLRFWDVMQICDVVVSKSGHGIVTDCAAMGVALLHPARNGFREDNMILRAGSRYFRERELPRDDYLNGNWIPHLDALLSQPKPAPATNTDGGEFVAKFICAQLSP